jgi:nucleotide-binding universal stress UspA family protein
MAADMAEDNRPVVVAFDGSPAAMEAVRTAAEIFRGRPVVVVSVWEPSLAVSESMMPITGIGGATYNPPSLDQMEALDSARSDHAQAAADAGARLASESGAQAEALCIADESDVADSLLAVTERRGAVALVVGARRMGRLKSALLGSTSRRVLHEAQCPVLVVREPGA